MDKVWIKDSGMADENAVQEIIQDSDMDAGTPFVAFYSDRIECGYLPDDFRIADEKHLLELRCFTDESELWLHRSRLAVPFAWRLADDRLIPENQSSEGSLTEAAHCRIETFQLLNIDRKRSSGVADGMAALVATGGGCYQLPMNEMYNAVRVMNYVSYDEIGMASVVDYRIAGFANVKKGDGYLCQEL